MNLLEQFLALQAEREPWRAAAACRDANPDWFFTPGGVDDRAAAHCEVCPVRLECLERALQPDPVTGYLPAGYWGGLSERARKRLKRQRLGG